MKKSKKSKPTIEELQYKLQQAYFFVEMLMGKQALDQLRHACDKEYAMMQTDRLLQIADAERFEAERMEIADANEWEYLEQR